MELLDERRGARRRTAMLSDSCPSVVERYRETAHQSPRGWENKQPDGTILTSGSMPLHEMLIELEVDVLIGPDPVQGKGTDLKRMGEQLRGKMCTWGGVNAFVTVEAGAKADIDAAVREAIAALGPDGFILSPVDNIRDPSDETWENVLALIESWKEYRV